MTWTDPYLAVWAAVFVAAAWLVPRRLQTTTMAVIGGLFLAIADMRSLVVLAALTAVALGVMRSTQPSKLRVAVVVLAVTGTVISFKWGVTLNDAVAGLIPLGLSYYTLRILHLVFEWSRHDRQHFGSAEVIRYLLFFPTQLAGPINRYPDFARDCRRRRWDTALFAIGLERVLYGSVKIVVLANYLVGAKMAVYLDTIPPPTHGSPRTSAVSNMDSTSTSSFPATRMSRSASPCSPATGFPRTSTGRSLRPTFMISGTVGTSPSRSGVVTMFSNRLPLLPGLPISAWSPPCWCSACGTN